MLHARQRAEPGKNGFLCRRVRVMREPPRRSRLGATRQALWIGLLAATIVAGEACGSSSSGGTGASAAAQLGATSGSGSGGAGGGGCACQSLGGACRSDGDCGAGLYCNGGSCEGSPE